MRDFRKSSDIQVIFDVFGEFDHENCKKLLGVNRPIGKVEV